MRVRSLLDILKRSGVFRIVIPLTDTKEFERAEKITLLVFLGTSLAVIILIGMLMTSIFLFKNFYLMDRLLVGLCVFAYLFIIFIFLRTKHFRIGSWLLILIFGVIGYYILTNWTINAPIGILALAFVIFLAGVMIGPNYIITVSFFVICIVFFIQFITEMKIINPDSSSLGGSATFGDAASYATVFAVYALIAWIASYQRERAINKARSAEKALQFERDQLEVRLDERTKSLRKAKLEETHQLYRFAELGQLTTMILHELANNLSVLNLDIDDLKERHKNSASINRAQESIKYLESIVENVRHQSNKSNQKIKFNVIKLSLETLSTLEARLKREEIDLRIVKNDNVRSFYTFGDPLRVSQILIILINNAIDAYNKSSLQTPRLITVAFSIESNMLSISVLDNGPGVPYKMRRDLFKPLRSNKPNGLGIGLFIAREIIQTNFDGNLKYKENEKFTEFTISMPSLNKINSPKPPKHSRQDP